MTHFHVFIVGDNLGGECVIADDRFVLDAGEDDASLSGGRARGGEGAASRRHRHRGTAAAAAWAEHQQNISHHTKQAHKTLAQI